EAIQWRGASPGPLFEVVAEAFEASARAAGEDPPGAISQLPPQADFEGELGERLLSHARLAVEAAAALHGRSPGPEGTFAIEMPSARPSLRDAFSLRSLELQHALRVATTAAAAATL